MNDILLFHKPKAVVVSRNDERGRKTVYDLLPDWVLKESWVPVGRLDRDSRGMLLFVKEGNLVEELGRPGHLSKTYEVWIRGRITEEQLDSLQQGVTCQFGLLRCDEIKVERSIGPKTQLTIALTEGRNRQIRRMLGALNDPERGTPLKVVELKRIAIGPISLDVASGEWRFLSSKEVHELLAGSSSL